MNGLPTLKEKCYKTLCVGVGVGGGVWAGAEGGWVGGGGGSSFQNKLLQLALDI